MWILINVLFMCCFAQVWSQCDSNWVRHAQSCYHFSHDEETWADALVMCRLFGAHLVEVTDTIENQFLVNTMKSSIIWLGMTDLNEEGVWQWMESNTDAQFTDWAPGEPNNSANENCAVLLHGGWNDGHCKDPTYYVCEREIENEPVVIG